MVMGVNKDMGFREWRWQSATHYSYNRIVLRNAIWGHLAVIEPLSILERLCCASSMQGSLEVMLRLSHSKVAIQCPHVAVQSVPYPPSVLRSIL